MNILDNTNAVVEMECVASLQISGFFDVVGQFLLQRFGQNENNATGYNGSPTKDDKRKRWHVLGLQKKKVLRSLVNPHSHTLLNKSKNKSYKECS